MKRPEIEDHWHRDNKEVKLSTNYYTYSHDQDHYIDHLEARIKELEEIRQVQTSNEDLIEDIEDAKRTFINMFPPEEYGESLECEKVYETLNDCLKLAQNHTLMPLLPSDGDIEEEVSKRHYLCYSITPADQAFRNGAQWLKSQIKGIPGELSEEDVINIFEIEDQNNPETAKNIQCARNQYKAIINHFNNNQ